MNDWNNQEAATAVALAVAISVFGTGAMLAMAILAPANATLSFLIVAVLGGSWLSASLQLARVWLSVANWLYWVSAALGGAAFIVFIQTLANI